MIWIKIIIDKISTYSIWPCPNTGNVFGTIAPIVCFFIAPIFILYDK